MRSLTCKFLFFFWIYFFLHPFLYSFSNRTQESLAGGEGRSGAKKVSSLTTLLSWSLKQRKRWDHSVKFSIWASVSALTTFDKQEFVLQNKCSEGQDRGQFLNLEITQKIINRFSWNFECVLEFLGGSYTDILPYSFLTLQQKVTSPKN